MRKNVSRIYLPPHHSSIRTSPQQRSHLIVIAKEGNNEFFRTVLKDKAQRPIATAFEKILAQFAYPETAMRVRLKNRLCKVSVAAFAKKAITTSSGSPRCPPQD